MNQDISSMGVVCLTSDPQKSDQTFSLPLPWSPNKDEIQELRGYLGKGPRGSQPCWGKLGGLDWCSGGKPCYPLPSSEATNLLSAGMNGSPFGMAKHLDHGGPKGQKLGFGLRTS